MTSRTLLDAEKLADRCREQYLITGDRDAGLLAIAIYAVCSVRTEEQREWMEDLLAAAAESCAAENGIVDWPEAI